MKRYHYFAYILMIAMYITLGSLLCNWKIPLDVDMVHDGSFPVPDQSQNVKKIPNILWTFWDSPVTTVFVSNCIKSWEIQNPDHEIIILNKANLNSYIDEKIPRNFDEIKVQFQADWVRLAVLSKHGGIWVDASMIMTKPIDFIHKKQEAEKSEGFMYYLNGWTFDYNYPYFENWLIAAVPESTLIKAWLSEFTVCFEKFGMKDSYLVYLGKVFGNGAYSGMLQGNVMPGYLKQHMALQKVLQIDHYPGFSSADADDENGPLLIARLSDWDNNEIALNLISDWNLKMDDKPVKVPPLIKIRSIERQFINLYTSSKWNFHDFAWFFRRLRNNMLGYHPIISPSSIYARYLATNSSI